MNTSIHSTQPLAPVLALFALLALVAPLAHAEKADREKPIFRKEQGAKRIGPRRIEHTLRSIFSLQHSQMGKGSFVAAD